MAAPPDPPATYGRALLISTLSSSALSAPRHLAPVLAGAARATRHRLVVVLLSPLFGAPAAPPPSKDTSADVDGAEHVPAAAAWDVRSPRAPGVPRVAQWDAVQTLLTYTYVQATGVAQGAGRVLMEVDVLLRSAADGLPEFADDEFDAVFGVEDEDCVIPLPDAISRLPTHFIPAADVDPAADGLPPASPEDESLPPLFPVVALGGTFDHLHAGHKILLSMAAWVTRDKLIVGITDDALLKNKSNKSVLEDFAARRARVHAFLALFRPDIALDLVAIADVAGPTGWDAHIQALVVSRETVGGAAAIDKIRAEKGLPELRTLVIDVISATDARLPAEDVQALRQAKMSSTFIRQWIVDHAAAPTPVSEQVGLEQQQQGALAEETAATG